MRAASSIIAISNFPAQLGGFFVATPGGSGWTRLGLLCRSEWCCAVRTRTPMSGENRASTRGARVADELVLVLDFGSQYAQLIARRVREQNVYCEIVRHNITADEIRARTPKGLILSGGPSSVYAEGAPRCHPDIFQLGIPVLGICYGMQLACELLGGKVKASPSREYGRAYYEITKDSPLLADLPPRGEVWMSHGDQVSEVSDDFEGLARTETCPIAAVKHRTLPVFGLQFHPEVTHTPHGHTVLRNFLMKVCGCRGTWQLGDFAQQTIEELR